jgi:hypothetical protein
MYPYCKEALLADRRTHPYPLCTERASERGRRAHAWDDQRRPREVDPDYCSSADCERVLVATGGAVDSSDGDAGFAGVVSTAGS